MRVHVIDPISEKALAYLRRSCEVTEGAAWPDAADALIVRTSPVGAAEIARAGRLKIIGKHGVGVDNIDLAAARARGIAVVNTPGANSDAVAELVLGLVVAASRHLVPLDRRLRAGARGALPVGREVAGRPVGVIGLGHVGRRVADLFRRAFRCPVLAYDPMVTDEAVAAVGAERAAELDDLLARSGIVTLHVPLTPATRNLIGARELALLPPGAILVNTARGGIVDEAALAAGLAEGRPAAAAADAFAQEPPPADHPLLRCANFIATPHIGAQTAEALDRVGLLVAEQVVEVLQGRQPRHPVP